MTRRGKKRAASPTAHAAVSDNDVAPVAAAVTPAVTSTTTSSVAHAQDAPLSTRGMRRAKRGRMMTLDTTTITTTTTASSTIHTNVTTGGRKSTPTQPSNSSSSSGFVWSNDAIQSCMKFLTWDEFLISMRTNHQWLRVAKNSSIKFDQVILDEAQLSELVQERNQHLQRHVGGLQCQINNPFRQSKRISEDEFKPFKVKFPSQLTSLQIKLIMINPDPDELDHKVFWSPVTTLISAISELKELRSLMIGFAVSAEIQYFGDPDWFMTSNVFSPLTQLLKLESLDMRLLNMWNISMYMQMPCPPLISQDQMNDIRAIPNLQFLHLGFSNHGGGLISLDVEHLTKDLTQPLQLREISLREMDHYDFETGNPPPPVVKFLPLIPSLTKLKLAGLNNQCELKWLQEGLVGTLPHLIDLTLIGASGEDPLEELEEACTGRAVVLTVVKAIITLKVLELNFDDLTSLALKEGLAPLKQLESLTIREAPELSSLEFLQVVPQLTILQLIQCTELDRALSTIDDVKYFHSIGSTNSSATKKSKQVATLVKLGCPCLPRLQVFAVDEEDQHFVVNQHFGDLRPFDSSLKDDELSEEEEKEEMDEDEE